MTNATKIYTITRTTNGSYTEYKQSGTLTELIEIYQYNLATGASYEHERGNKKIIMKPKTARSLVTQLNSASRNSSLSGNGSSFYELTGGV